jgi:23S rRNA (pseudouridine1915-N3)-methyltransferase
MNFGDKRINFIVGGAFGLSNDVKVSADVTLSLSSMTLPHELCALILMEQVYRAMTLLRGIEYHY